MLRGTHHRTPRPARTTARRTHVTNRAPIDPTAFRGTQARPASPAGPTAFRGTRRRMRDVAETVRDGPELDGPERGDGDGDGEQATRRHRPPLLTTCPGPPSAPAVRPAHPPTGSPPAVRFTTRLMLR
ncbi:hypothetical protein GCM10009613_22340 [Pseudonocardia kongjuensis]|uniref:Uncharacterized protein n=1 Tax=Pseudonocardia kongjuensis TaxID=102227 RepID=A0ABP4IGU0_9PSEU